MKNSSGGLATAVSMAAFTAAAWPVMGVATAHPKAAGASRSDFHCSASSQAPSGALPRAPGRLVPPTPTALGLCRYGPAPGSPLQTSKLVTKRKTVHRLVRGLNALPTMPTDPTSCPADNGSEIVVYAMYKRAATRMVHVGLSGCLIARRGDVVRWDLPSGGHFIGMLERLAG